MKLYPICLQCPYFEKQGRKNCYNTEEENTWGRCMAGGKIYGIWKAGTYSTVKDFQHTSFLKDCKNDKLIVLAELEDL